MLTFYLLLAAVGAAFDYIIYRYITMLPEELLRIIAAAVWAVILLIALVVIPHYFIHSKVVITNNEVASAGGFVTYTNDYMPISSIKSVSVVLTPLGSITGFNFVLINALGARMLLSFYKKSDVMDMSKRINDMIKQRDRDERRKA